MTTIFPTGFNGFAGVWVLYYEGMRTGFRDNDFYAGALAVFLTEAEAVEFLEADYRLAGSKISFLPFGRMLRHAWEGDDHLKVRFVAPGFPVKEASGGDVWMVFTVGRRVGRSSELCDVFFFPDEAEAKDYQALVSDRRLVSRVLLGKGLTEG